MYDTWVWKYVTYVMLQCSYFSKPNPYLFSLSSLTSTHVYFCTVEINAIVVKLQGEEFKQIKVWILGAKADSFRIKCCM